MDLPISFSLCAVMDLPIYKKWVVLDLSISFLWVVMDLSISFLWVVMDLSISFSLDGFEPPKARASRFTVCPIWPLW